MNNYTSSHSFASAWIQVLLSSSTRNQLYRLISFMCPNPTLDPAQIIDLLNPLSFSCDFRLTCSKESSHWGQYCALRDSFSHTSYPWRYAVFSHLCLFPYRNYLHERTDHIMNGRINRAIPFCSIIRIHYVHLCRIDYLQSNWSRSSLDASILSSRSYLGHKLAL